MRHRWLRKSRFLLSLHIWCIWTYRRYKFLICNNLRLSRATRGIYNQIYAIYTRSGQLFRRLRIVPLFPREFASNRRRQWQERVVMTRRRTQVRAYSVKNVNKPWQHRRCANTTWFLCDVRTCRSHRRVLKPADNKCKDNEGVVRASTAGIRPADKAPVSRGMDTTERQCGNMVDAHGA